ncbi:MAG: cytochrome C oxidase assembly protein [Acidiferrobacter sp.]
MEHKDIEHNVVHAEVTTAVRAANMFIISLIIVAIGAGLWRGVTTTAFGRVAWVQALMLTQVLLASAIILLGSLVEGFGFGLSLGTRWPYSRNIIALLVRGDPEAAHRVVATSLGLIGVLLVILGPSTATVTGLLLIVATALFGMGTLYVLAGRVPAFVHGTHGLLAYAVLLSYLVGLLYPGVNFLAYVEDNIALHALLLAIFLGGMTTGQRGFGQPIGAFVKPERISQWTVSAHIVAALLVVGTLGWLMPAYPIAFFLAVAQTAVGFLLFHGVNLRPKAPGAIVVIHQATVLLMVLAIVFPWR